MEGCLFIISGKVYGRALTEILMEVVEGNVSKDLGKGKGLWSRYVQLKFW